MQVHVESLSKIKKKINFEIPADRVDVEIDKAYEEIRKRAEIKGFRKGKAPMSFIQKNYGAMMEQDVIKNLFSETYFKALHDEKLYPVEHPVIESDELKKGEPFRYSATVEIYPEVTAANYKGLEVMKERFVMDPEVVDRRINEIRENMAQLQPAEEGRSAALGDFLTIDFKGFIDGVQFENGSAEDFHLELGAGRFIPGFEEQIVGVKCGEGKNINVTFPEDYGNKELAGKEATFEVAVKEIKVKQLPEIDDEFAKEIGEFDSLDQMKSKIAEVYESQERDRIDGDLRDRIVKTIVEKNPLEIPGAMVDKQLQIMLDGTKKRLTREKLSLEMVGMDDEKYKSQYRDRAEEQVKGALLLDSIAEQEGIKVEDSDIDEKIREMAEERKQELEPLKQYYDQNKNARDFLKDQIREDKIFGFLEKNAAVKEVSREELSAKPDAPQIIV
jgi:trigger factor